VTAKPRKKAAPERTIRLLRSPLQSGVGLMAITSNRRTNYYAFKEIACDIGGRAFTLHRLGLGNLYHVRVGTAEECSCECLGFLQHRRCKHVLGLLALTGHELI
jgi:SWIM zinc finger